MASAVSNVTTVYGHFFEGCLKGSVIPYLVVGQLFIKDEERIKPEEVICGAALCAALTFVVPILPALTAITCELAIFVACCALASMPLVYLTAAAIDLFVEDNDSGMRPVC
jgi:hypothetical protein